MLEQEEEKEVPIKPQGKAAFQLPAKERKYKNNSDREFRSEMSQAEEHPLSLAPAEGEERKMRPAPAAQEQPKVPGYKAKRDYTKEEIVVQKLLGRMENLPSLQILETTIDVYSFDMMKLISDGIIVNNPTDSGMGSVNDPRLSMNEYCTHCHVPDCPGHYGLIEFKAPIINPLYHRQVINILSIICNSCGSLLYPESSMKADGMLSMMPDARLKALEVKAKGLTCTAMRNSAVPGGKTITCQKNPLYSYKRNNESSNVYYTENVRDDKQSAIFVSPGEILKKFEQITDHDAELMGFNVGVWRKVNLGGEKVFLGQGSPSLETADGAGNLDWYIDKLSYKVYQFTEKAGWEEIYRARGQILFIGNTHPSQDPASNKPQVLNATYYDQGTGTLYRYIPGSHPRNLIMQGLLVPPLNTRPPMEEGGKVNPDMLNGQFNLIIKANLAINPKDPDSFAKTTEELYSAVRTLAINPDNKPLGNREFQDIQKRLQSKEGAFRSLLMGKRGDFCGRAVLAPDPNLKFGQLGVPEEWAPILTKRVRVNALNRGALQALMAKGKISNYLQAGAPTNHPIRVKEGDYYELEIGDYVERHLQDGDRINFNRAPTLHKEGLMKFEVVLGPQRTLRLHLSYTTPYNADFDGDEGTLYDPMDLEVEAEGEELMGVSHCIMSGESNRPMMGMVLDAITGAYKMTDPTVFVDDQVFNHCLMLITHKDQLATLYPRLDSAGVHYRSGKALFSSRLPADFNYQSGKVRIVDGVLIQGQISKAHIGTSHRSIIQELWKNYGRERTVAFFTDAPYVINYWLGEHGFSVGAGDCRNILPVVKSAEEITAERVKAMKAAEAAGFVVEERVRSVAEGGNLERMRRFGPGYDLKENESLGTFLARKREEGKLTTTAVIDSRIPRTKNVDLEEVVRDEITSAKVKYEANFAPFPDPIREENRKRKLINILGSVKSVGEIISKQYLMGVRGEVEKLNKDIDLSGLLNSRALDLKLAAKAEETWRPVLAGKADNFFPALEAARSLAAAAAPSLQEESQAALRRLTEVASAGDEGKMREIRAAIAGGQSEEAIRLLTRLEDGVKKYVKNTTPFRRTADILRSPVHFWGGNYLAAAAAPLAAIEEELLATWEKRTLLLINAHRAEMKEAFESLLDNVREGVKEKETNGILTLTRVLEGYIQAASNSMNRPLYEQFQQLLAQVNRADAPANLPLLPKIAAAGKQLAEVAPIGENAIGLMLESGAKGSIANLSQIRGVVGQQFLFGQPLPPQLEGGSRCFPQYDPGEIDPEAYGFCSSSFWTGLTTTEFFAATTGARESITDTATKTSETGSTQHMMMKAFENFIVAADGSVRSTGGALYQTVYGNHGYDVSEMLKVKTPGYEELASFVDVKSLILRLNAKRGWIPKDAAAIIQRNQAWAREEKALALRIRQLRDGAEPMIETARPPGQELTPAEIAEQELELGLLDTAPLPPGPPIAEAARRQAWTPDKPTRFEVAALIGKRANMIAAGSEPRVDPGDIIDPITIARMELDAGVLPLEIIREYPDKSVETIKVGV